jgi:hypothetical protein
MCCRRRWQGERQMMNFPMSCQNCYYLKMADLER